MMNEVDIENLTIEQYLMFTQEKQTQRMIRTESGNKPNDYHLFTLQSHYETEEVSSNEDVDEWLNEELSKRMTGEDKEEEEDALIDILKIVVEECTSVYKKAQIRTPSCRTSKIQGVSFVAEEEDRDSSETLPYQQPSNEINPKSFTLPCTFGNLKIYIMTDVGAGINMMPKSLFEHLKLANLKKTSMAIEMGNMTHKAPLGIVKNILVKIYKFLFHFDFVVIETLETILLGRPFLATIHAQIDVFRGEISLGVGNEKVKFDMNGEICHSMVPFEKIYMVSSIQESEYVNPHEIENDDSPALGQRTFHYSKESVNTVDSSSDSQENEVGSHLSEIVSRWHVCKPVHITFKVCEEDCRIWPTCNPDLSFCSGYDAIYGKEENGILKQWICFRDHERQNVRGNGMKFDDLLKVNHGNKNIANLVNEYELKAGRKRYALEEIWEKCEKFHDSTKQWYDEGFEEEELWQNGIEEIDYTPLLAKNETFEVHRYTFKNGKSFICITKQMNDVLPLGRVNGSKFIWKTRKEMDEEGGDTRKT
nr:hypothetical protein [Tanacetum cinerariifolium]